MENKGVLKCENGSASFATYDSNNSDVFVSTVTIINGFRMFEESFVYWEAGSPGNIGLSVIGYIYKEGIQQNDLGFGSAIGVALMIIIFVISIIYLIATGTFKGEDKK